ncbi:MAG: T9SS type A sorting domain-containing protein [Candidatus Zixiibacteriota bacterium]|nr:MAG: T9SS type A sorting domain-containing protein [candidate division Zixibacteria bacterium]
MHKSYFAAGVVLSAMTLLLLGGVAIAADQVSVMPDQGTDYEALEEEGLELEPTTNNSGNNGTIPTIDSIPPDGALMIPESGSDVVGLYDPFDGTFLGNLIFGSGTLATPINAIQGSDGNIYVSDQISDGVFVYDTTGAYLYTYCDGSDGLDNVRGIDFRNDTLFVTSGGDYVAMFDAPHSRLPDFISGGINPFDIYFLEDGQALVSCLSSPAGVRLYDANGSFVSTVISVSFPEQTQLDELDPGDFLNASFSSNVVSDFDIDGTIYQTTPLSSGRGAYRLGNGNLLVTSSAGVREMEPGTGNVIEIENTGQARFIELYRPEVTGDPGALMGTVTDLQLNPIEGAIVAIGYRRDTTDVSGSYFFELYPNTYTATASAQYHNPVTIEDIVVVENETTTVDFALSTPLINVNTSPVELEVDSGEVVTVTRNIANVGDGVLEFDVDVVIGDLILSANPGRGERVANAVDPEGAADVAPYSFSGPDLPVITDYRDSLFTYMIEDATGDNGCLGVEFDGTHFWVTGRNASGGDVHKLHKFDRDGNLITSYNQGTSSVWGWRDMAWDGEYLYASDENEFAKIDPATGMKIGTLPRPPGLSPVRAVAWDPATDHFWGANFSSNIYEFDRSGTIISQYSNSKAAYGMAWDDVSEGGPYIWVNSQDGSPQIQISQFDPSTGTYTGETWQSSLPTGHSAALAGGACFTTEWDPSVAALIVLGQGTPTDFIYGYEIAPYSQWLIVDPMSGVLQPAENIDLDITIDFTAVGLNYDSCYQATIMVYNNTPDTPEIPVSINCGVTDLDEISGLPREFSVAQNYPNPFNAGTNISFALPQQSEVKVEVYNLLGQKTATLFDGLLPAGNHTVTWDASEVASGVYYYKISAGDYSAIRMMTLLK